jgi:hypothetical protein
VTRRSTQQIAQLLLIYSATGNRLADLPPLLGRTRETLRRHAKQTGVTFPDYKPRNKK